MIEIKKITKSFCGKRALSNVSFTIDSGCIFGLVGSNGAGKSTILRILAGVYRPDSGEVLLGGEAPYENNNIKAKTLFISDNPYFFSQSTLTSMARFYKQFFPSWSDEDYKKYRAVFPIDEKMKIASMSKGMQRQAALILGLSCCPEYVLFDEIFDGLDPVVREVLKRILVDFVSEKKATVIISSHNLRELEELCDHIGLIHKGGVIFESDLDNLKLGVYHVQAVFKSPEDFLKVKAHLNVLKSSQKGKITDFVAKNNKDEIIEIVEKQDPMFSEMLPLTLEEVFICEMEVAGYEVGKQS